MYVRGEYTGLPSTAKPRRGDRRKYGQQARPLTCLVDSTLTCRGGNFVSSAFGTISEGSILILGGTRIPLQHSVG